MQGRRDAFSTFAGQKQNISLSIIFLHDNYWVKATVEFSDGSRLDIPLVKSAKPQSVAFEPKRVRSLVLKDLIQAEGTSPFPALTQIEAFGTEVK